MAKDSFSFDVVSEVDMVEVANALDQARREVGTRFDFKNTGTEITQDDQLIEIRSATEDRLKAALDVVKVHERLLGAETAGEDVEQAAGISTAVVTTVTDEHTRHGTAADCRSSR